MQPEAKRSRIEKIDMMRGFSMFVMILLHTNAYFLSIPLVFFLWNAGQFAVPIFIFCSSYLFFVKTHIFKTPKDVLLYIRRRLSRLLIPYYIFAAFYILLQSIKEPSRITLRYLFQNAFIIEGISINWLILLFIFFTFLTPFLFYMWTHNRIVFYFYTALSLFSSVFLMFNHFPYNYRLIMWLPWSLIVIFSFYVAKNEQKKSTLYLMFLFWIVVFLMMYYIQVRFGFSLRMYDNKYPPNLYHLSFGLFSIPLLYLAAKNGFLSLPGIKEIFHFLSIHSYSLYFIHWVVLYIVTAFFHFKFTCVSFFLTILISSVIVQVVLNRFSYIIRSFYRFSALKRGPTI